MKNYDAKCSYEEEWVGFKASHPKIVAELYNAWYDAHCGCASMGLVVDVRESDTGTVTTWRVSTFLSYNAQPVIG